jgi:4-hydroxybenzoate polyprenyltransferase
MFGFFDLLDRAFDTLAHAFDDKHAPETPRSRPQVVLFLLAAALVPIALVLGWEWSPWLLGLLGLIGAVVFAGLYAIWTN